MEAGKGEKKRGEVGRGGEVEREKERDAVMENAQIKWW
jgi:hypothetical protein